MSEEVMVSSDFQFAGGALLADGNTPLAIARRFVLWSVVCWISAGPSFFWAHDEFDRGAMVLGVCLFSILYTLFTSTPAFHRFKRRPFIRRTLYIGYGLRLALSICYPIGMVADALPGLFSVGLIESLGMETKGFVGTLAITCVQGALLNLIITLFMVVVYAIERAFLKAPELQPRGFEVILPGPTSTSDGARQRPSHS